jgi:hypothetical protein
MVTMMSHAHEYAEDDAQGTWRCWCCGAITQPDRTIRLGNHPEVMLCVRCGYWAGKQAWEFDDRDKTGPAVMVRAGFRKVRRTVVDHGWHQSALIGKPVRWLGRHLP